MARSGAGGLVLEEPRHIPVASRAMFIGRGFLRFCVKYPLGAVGALVCATLLICAVFAPLIATHHYSTADFGSALQGSSSDHLLGTDQLGRDVFSRLVYASRVVAVVAFGSVALGSVIGLLVGIASAYFGSVLDLLALRFVDIFLAFPGIVLVILIVAFLGTGMIQLILIFGFLLSLDMTRMVRSQAISVSAEPYVEAARVIGCTNWRVMYKYIFPNVVPLMLVLASVAVGSIILGEAAVSFLGYGIPPPHPSWGQMLSSDGLTYMHQHPILAIYPGLALAVTVFAFNVLGDALRDAFDPRRRGI